MKLPSLDIAHITQGVYATFRRFAPAVLCALATTGIAIGLIYDVWLPVGDTQSPAYDRAVALQSMMMRLAFGLGTGVPLLTAAQLWAEQSRRKLAVWAGISACFGALLYYAYAQEHNSEWFIGQMLLLHIAAQALAAIAPYVNKGRETDFWHFNKVLFLRYFTASLYAATLFLGLAGALGIVSTLFSIQLKGEEYGLLFFTFAFTFHPIFFLAGVPSKDVLATSSDGIYPKPLKAFAQYVLLPLVVIYLGILYAYMGRIFILQEWPQGLVSWLVFGFAVVGILAFLLLWPLRETDGTRWVRSFTRLFYVALIPLVFLEAAALYKRVDAYGFTEERVLLLLLTCWLAGVSVVGLWSHGRLIRIIPGTLIGVLVLVAVGASPLGVASQQLRVVAWLKTQKMLKEGILLIPSATQYVSQKSFEDFSSQLSYLEEHNALHKTLIDFFPPGKLPKFKTIEKHNVELFGHTYGSQGASVDQWLSALKISTKEIEIVPDQPYSDNKFYGGTPLHTHGAKYVIVGVKRMDTTIYTIPNMGQLYLLVDTKQKQAVFSTKSATEKIDLTPYLDSEIENDSVLESSRYIPIKLKGLEGYYYLNTLSVDADTVKKTIYANFLILLK